MARPKGSSYVGKTFGEICDYLRTTKKFKNATEAAIKKEAERRLDKYEHPERPRRGRGRPTRGETVLVLGNGMEIKAESVSEGQHLRSLYDEYNDGLVDFKGFYHELYKLLQLELRYYRLTTSGDKNASQTKTFKDIELANKTSTEIRQLKESMGISRKDQTGGNMESTKEYWAELQERAKEYRKENLGNFRHLCGFCGSYNVHDLPHWAYVHCDTPLEERDCVKCMDSSVPGEYSHLPLEQRLKYRTNLCGKKAWSHELGKLVKDKVLTVQQASKVLQVAPIGFLMLAEEMGFDLGIEFDLNKPDSLLPYVT